MIFYLLMSLTFYIAEVVFVFDCKCKSNIKIILLTSIVCCVDMPAWACFFNIGITILCTVSHLLAACTKPGYLTNDSVDFLDMLKHVDPYQLCPDCKCIKTSRSRHCPVCKHCIERYDHHCPWINNCVGLHNHNAFYMYLLTQWILIVTAFGQGGTALFWFVNKEFPDDGNSLFSYTDESMLT